MSQVFNLRKKWEEKILKQSDHKVKKKTSK